MKFKDKEFVTFVNIDGEFYEFSNIETIVIQEASEYCQGGNLRILVRPK